MVNETWIPDIARFGHHFADSAERLTTPLIRKNDQLVEASWDEALTLVANKLQEHAETATGLAGDRLSNEDLFTFQKLFRKVLKNDNIDLANKRIAGGDVTAQVGITAGTNLLDLGKGDVVAVIASDLHAEAPMWWLRLKQAAERGATIITINLRATRLDKFAAHAVRYAPGELLELVAGLGSADDEYAVAMRDAENLLVYYGGEGLSYAETDALAKSLGNFLIETKHFSKAKNGLVAVWPHCNTQGAWDTGVVNEWTPSYREHKNPGLNAEAAYAGKAKALYIMGADPVGDGLMSSRDGVTFLVVQELFMTATAQMADVVLPAQSWAERDGTFTNGERRVQRYYPAIQKVGDSRPDWQIVAGIISKITEETVPFAASLVFSKEVAKGVRPYKGMTYRSLGEAVEQFPVVGGEDLYYGGTSYKNEAGVGQQWSAFGKAKSFDVPELASNKSDAPTVVNIAASYTPGTLLNKSEIIAPRMAEATVFLNSADAGKWNFNDGDQIGVLVNGETRNAKVHVNGVAPKGVVLLQGFGNTVKVDLTQTN